MTLCHAPVTSDPVTLNPRAQEHAAQHIFWWTGNYQIIKLNLTLWVIFVENMSGCSGRMKMADGISTISLCVESNRMYTS